MSLFGFKNLKWFCLKYIWRPIMFDKGFIINMNAGHHICEIKCIQHRFIEPRKSLSIKWNDYLVFNNTEYNAFYDITSKYINIKSLGYTQISFEEHETSIHAIYNEFIEKYPKFTDILDDKCLIKIVSNIHESQCTNSALNHKETFKEILTTNYMKEILENPGNIKSHPFIELTKEFQIPPLMLLKNYISETNLFTKRFITDLQKPKLSTDDLIKQYKSKENAHLDTIFYDTCREIISLDKHCNAECNVIRQHEGKELEIKCAKLLKYIIENAHLDDYIEFKTEKDLIRKNAGLTPDILFMKPIIINDNIVHWIDLKNFFLNTNEFLGKKTKKKAQQYNDKYGLGCIISYGYMSDSNFPALMLDGSHLI